MSDIDYARLEIYRLGNWIWQVHENQSYLGRVIIRLNRPEMLSLSQCTTEEWMSLHENIKTFEKLLRRLFSPDRFNYAQMGNVYPQLHVQAVPRYASQRVWKNKVFYDKQWGKNWAPTPPSPLTLTETYKFASWLESEMQKEQGLSA
jgi:diadenosine tetraphosphate (Ap4A) HIT family hydrolase